MAVGWTEVADDLNPFSVSGFGRLNWVAVDGGLTGASNHQVDKYAPPWLTLAWNVLEYWISCLRYVFGYQLSQRRLLGLRHDRFGSCIEQYLTFLVQVLDLRVSKSSDHSEPLLAVLAETVNQGSSHQ